MSRYRHAAHSDVHAFQKGRETGPHGNRFGHCEIRWCTHMACTRVADTQKGAQYADAHRRPICPSGHGPPDERSWQLGSVWPWASLTQPAWAPSRPVASAPWGTPAQHAGLQENQFPWH